MLQAAISAAQRGTQKTNDRRTAADGRTKYSVDIALPLWNDYKNLTVKVIYYNRFPLRVNLKAYSYR